MCNFETYDNSTYRYSLSLHIVNTGMWHGHLIHNYRILSLSMHVINLHEQYSPILVVDDKIYNYFYSISERMHCSLRN